jgi:hypothetical protein
MTYVELNFSLHLTKDLNSDFVNSTAIFSASASLNDVMTHLASFSHIGERAYSMKWEFDDLSLVLSHPSLEAYTKEKKVIHLQYISPIVDHAAAKEHLELYDEYTRISMEIQTLEEKLRKLAVERTENMTKFYDARLKTFGATCVSSPYNVSLVDYIRTALKSKQ